MNKKHIAILFGGTSAEHDVSVITALQVIEAIDTNLFIPHAIRLEQAGQFVYLAGLTNRKEYKKVKQKMVLWGVDRGHVFIKEDKNFTPRIYLEAAFLAFHGGTGESGQVQGMLEALGLPFTSPGCESSVLCMNKVLTKQILTQNNINTLEFVNLTTNEISNSLEDSVKKINRVLKLPLIIKPAHLGSSIGIAVAKTQVELKKYIMQSSFVDTEILVEPFISGFKEYNCSVRRIGSSLEMSEVEEPLAADEILSFADKYQRGGNKKAAGMASLTRKLPADIQQELKNRIQKTAGNVFEVLRCKSMVRIDFMYYKNKLYVTEVNPIPGSMSFYLWEASGVQFTQQITDMINQSLIDQAEKASKVLKYSSDIVDKFVNQ